MSRQADAPVVLVTGGSRGIGAATAVRLGELGATVVINYRRGEEAAHEVARRVEAVGGRATVLRADIASPRECCALVGSALEAHGRVDVLVNNAGIQRLATVAKMRDEDWQDVIDVNLSAPFHLARAVLPDMIRRGSGHILNVTSASAYHAHPGISGYVAAKQGLVGLTRALAVETARHGIRVNAIAPGLVETDMIAGLDAKQRERIRAIVPMGRAAEPREIAETIAWIVTESRYSTGNVFHASGGVVMG